MALPLTDEPRDLLLGTDNDLVITTDLQFSRGIAGVVQSCRIKMQMFAGEWFLNLDAGIPYWDEILAEKPAAAIVAAASAFRTALESIRGVIEVTKLDITYDGSTRKMTAEWQVRTGSGDTPPDKIALNTGADA